MGGGGRGLARVGTGFGLSSVLKSFFFFLIVLGFLLFVSALEDDAEVEGDDSFSEGFVDGGSEKCAHEGPGEVISLSESSSSRAWSLYLIVFRNRWINSVCLCFCVSVSLYACSLRVRFNSECFEGLNSSLRVPDTSTTHRHAHKNERQR
ncbi:hypothetical protein C8R42DRAFT_692058 [Lentinula raphanica]|nr:hypothetical protein C8R42DRAFT_692058 [Lentinula raphanica]